MVKYAPLRTSSHIYIYILIGLISFSFLSGFILSSSFVSADDVIDDISITVPVACTMSGVGMNTHTATINPGTYNSAIGTTTLKVLCNDAEGFAIYAIGYTNNEDGNNTLTSTTLSAPITINTGTALSGDSQWAMKLATDSGATYPVTIQNSFDSFHTVPDDYALVVKRLSSTDIGASAVGSVLTTTYQAYISSTQNADTYVGKVKYVMVHPNDADAPVKPNQVAINYHGNGLYFDQAETITTNRVLYEYSYGDEYGYIGQPVIMSTDNLDSAGNQSGPYNDGTYFDGELPVNGYVEFEGAAAVKLEVTYSLSEGGYVNLGIGGEGICNDDCDLGDSSINRSGTYTFVKSGDWASAYMEVWDAPDPDYDYGIYIKAYPIYNGPHEGATYGIVQEDVLTLTTVSGTYTETTPDFDLWFIEEDECSAVFYNESEIQQDLLSCSNYYEGTTIDLYSNNYFTIVFNANGGTGYMESQSVLPFHSEEIDTNTFTRQGKKWASWNTSPDGSGTTYEGNYHIWRPLARGGESITLYAQWKDCEALTICYDDNGASSPTTMGDQTITKSYTSVGLWPSNYQRSGYGFAGWNTKADGTGTSYGPMEIIMDSTTVNTIKQEGLKLYAMWIPSAGNLQNWSGCGTLNTGEVTALTDLRDNDTYAVAKLADGNCWMIENLRLDYNANFTESLSQGFGKSTTFGNFIGLANPEIANFSDSYVANSIYYSGSQSGTATINIGSSDTSARFRFPRYRNDNTNSDTSKNPNITVSNMTSPNSNVYSYGNYYSWAAAMANTINYKGPTFTDVDGKTSETVNTSICPAGWRLPYGRNTGNGATSGGFYYLGTQLGAVASTSASSRTWRRFPNNFLISGAATSSQVNGRNTSGTYWSSTASNDLQDSTYVLVLTSSTLQPGTENYIKYTGYSIRCVNL